MDLVIWLNTEKGLVSDYSFMVLTFCVKDNYFVEWVLEKGDYLCKERLFFRSFFNN